MTTNASRPAKGKKVETLRQARTFDSTKGHYVKLGLCKPCAAQAAWGHQLGFSELLHQPCDVCQVLVDTFPVSEPGRWRSNSPRRGAKFSLSLRAGLGP